MNEKKESTNKTKLHRDEDIKKHKEAANNLNEDNAEYGGQEGPDPTRFGDWEKGGRCTDF